MTITRRHHPLEGKTLEVFSLTHRHGCLQLILVRPDGTRSMIRANWTDLDAQPDNQTADGKEQSAPQPETIGSSSALLHTRTIVDALLRRGDSSASEQQEEEGGRANGAELHGDPRTDPTGLEDLDDEQRQAVIDKVSRLITKAALADQSDEEDTDD